MAASTRRRHFVRALRRIAVLAMFDVGALVAAGMALRVLAGSTLVGDTALWLSPPGYLEGWGSIAAIVLGLAFAGAYHSQERWASVSAIFKGVALGVGLATWQWIDSLGMVWTGARWVLAVLSLGALVGLVRGLLGVVVLRYRLVPAPADRFILVGDPGSRTGRRAAKAMLSKPGMESLGWLSEQVDVRDHLGHPSAVWEVLRDTGTDTLVLCGELAPKLFDTVVEAAAVAGCRVLSARARGTLLASQPRALNGGGLRMLELTFPASRAGQDVVKRAFDIVGSLALLVLLTPVLIALSAWIKLDSGGPVLFIQERVGQAGAIFRMMKFRTMSVGAEGEKDGLAHLNHSGDERLFKIPDDPRTTRAGRFLRRWSLDELPQLVNVLRGDMSLVGPRPFFESDLAAYDDRHFIRLTVKPGMTGLWQVRGRSSIMDFEAVVGLDREYVENWSFGLDLKILVHTVPAVVRRTGAY